MTSQEQSQTKKYIQTNYADNSVELLEELDRYINTNNARNGNKLTFVNLTHELRTAIATIKGKSTGKLVR